MEYPLFSSADRRSSNWRLLYSPSIPPSPSFNSLSFEDKTADRRTSKSSGLNSSADEELVSGVSFVLSPLPPSPFRLLFFFFNL